MDTKTLHIYIIGPETYIAYDIEDAWRCLEEQTGLKKGDPDIGDDGPILVPDNQPLTIHPEEEGKPETFTAAEWCVREGRGFLCSTEH